MYIDDLYILMNVYAYIYMCTYILIEVYVWIYICMYIYVYVYIYVSAQEGNYLSHAKRVYFKIMNGTSIYLRYRPRTTSQLFILLNFKQILWSESSRNPMCKHTRTHAHALTHIHAHAHTYTQIHIYMYVDFPVHDLLCAFLFWLFWWKNVSFSSLQPLTPGFAESAHWCHLDPSDLGRPRHLQDPNGTNVRVRETQVSRVSVAVIGDKSCWNSRLFNITSKIGNVASHILDFFKFSRLSYKRKLTYASFRDHYIYTNMYIMIYIYIYTNIYIYIYM